MAGVATAWFCVCMLMVMYGAAVRSLTVIVYGLLTAVLTAVVLLT